MNYAVIALIVWALLVATAISGCGPAEDVCIDDHGHQHRCGEYPHPQPSIIHRVKF